MPESHLPHVLALSGAVDDRRRTSALALALLDAIAAVTVVRTSLVDLRDAGLDLCDGRAPDAYGRRTRELTARVGSAAGLVVATPVYRASFSAVLKNFLDLLPPAALAGTPVVIAVTGGSRDHFLVGDYALRPVLASLGALTLPQVVYADAASMADGLVGEQLTQEIGRAATQLARAVAVDRSAAAESHHEQEERDPHVHGAAGR